MSGKGSFHTDIINSLARTMDKSKRYSLRAWRIIFSSHVPTLEMLTGCWRGSDYYGFVKLHYTSDVRFSYLSELQYIVNSRYVKRNLKLI